MINAIRARWRVKRGALLLDRERPGWAQHINMDLLDMGSSNECVLGQLWTNLGLVRSNLKFTAYHDATHELLSGRGMPRREAAVKYGFNQNYDLGPRYRDLELAWRDEITRRGGGYSAFADATTDWADS